MCTYGFILSVPSLNICQFSMLIWPKGEQGTSKGQILRQICFPNQSSVQTTAQSQPHSHRKAFLKIRLTLNLKLAVSPTWKINQFLLYQHVYKRVYKFHSILLSEMFLLLNYYSAHYRFTSKLDFVQLTMTVWAPFRQFSVHLTFCFSTLHFIS